MMRSWLLLPLLLAALPCVADTLHVGPNSQYKAPSEAIQAATDGDTVEIEAGVYYDCSRVTADHLLIVGLDDGATFSDTTCDGKAQLVVKSQDVTIKNVNFERARVSDGNGAGIRAEGRDLTIEKARFTNNQSAILAAASPHSVITIRNSIFENNGACTPTGRCIATLSIGDIARLHVEKSTLTGARGGMLVLSGARRTEIYSSTLSDGPEGKSIGLVQANIGSLVLDDNKLQKKTPYANRAAAVFVLPSDAPQGDLIFTNNSYVDETGQPSAFVINYSGAAPSISGNVIPVGEEEISNDGILRYHAGATYRAAKDRAMDAARLMKWGIKTLLGR